MGTQPGGWGAVDRDPHESWTRIALGVGLLFIVSLVIFWATELLPGDLGDAASGAGRNAGKRSRRCATTWPQPNPAPVRYWARLTGALTGDFGVSLANNRPIAELIGARLGNTVFLALYAAAMSVPIALTLGNPQRAVAQFAVRQDRQCQARSARFPSPSSSSPTSSCCGLGAIGLFPVDGADQSDLPILANRLYMTFLPALTLDALW